MADGLPPDVAILKRDGVRLAHVEAGPAVPLGRPILFVHGWCCNLTSFAPQIAHFAGGRRVVAVDLRGHGRSDAPRQDYTMPGFADDVAWQCRQLALDRPVIVGHSMGGNVALELASRHPGLVAGIVMIDSVILPPREFTEALGPLMDALRGPDYVAAMWQGCSGLFLETDDPALREAVIAEAVTTPQHVIVSALENHTIRHDATAAAKACKAPIAYIAASAPLIEAGRNLERFRQLCPQLITAKTLGAGHFSTLDVPTQINAMIDRFLLVGMG